MSRGLRSRIDHLSREARRLHPPRHRVVRDDEVLKRQEPESYAAWQVRLDEIQARLTGASGDERATIDAEMSRTNREYRAWVESVMDRFPWREGDVRIAYVREWRIDATRGESP